MIKSIKDYKDLKKIKVIAEDLQKIDTLLTTCNTMLDPFKKYKYVMEIISVISNNKTLIKIHLNKSHRLLDEK